LRISEAAHTNHEEWFPNHKSTLKISDPGLIEVFDNFAFDEVMTGELNSKTRVIVTLRHEGRIWAGGVEKEVTFVNAEASLTDQIDAVYRAKYRHYPTQYVDHVTSAVARSATIKIVPR
jgi:hypothetical protein